VPRFTGIRELCVLLMAGLAVALVSTRLNATETTSPAQLVEFQLREAGENKKISLILTPEKIRVDQPAEKFAAIYLAAGDKYTGLELRDATYWEFSWPEVQAVVQRSKRYERRLHDLNIEGMASYDLTRPDPAESLPESPIYLWRPTGVKRKIGIYETAQWIGQSASAPSVEAWCVEKELPGLKLSLDQIKKINEPMALVPVRPILPAIAFRVVDSLFKAHVTPIEILWGDGGDRNRLTLTRLESKKMDLKSFAVPNTFRKVQLNALDGILENDSKGTQTLNPAIH
jgi:hypothetical protein